VNSQEKWHHMTVSSKSNQGKEQEEGRSGGDGGEIEWKPEVNTRVVSKQNELVYPLEWMATVPPHNKTDNLLLPGVIHTKSHQFPFNSCWNLCVLHNLLPNTTLKLPVNTFSPLGTPLVLTSDNFHSIFSPSPPSSSSYFPWWLLLETNMW
jgi:hypothetical protein